MKLKQLEQHLQEVEGFENPKILLGEWFLLFEMFITFEWNVAQRLTHLVDATVS